MANTSDVPDERSITAFMKALLQHDKVASVTRYPNGLALEATLKGGTVLRIRMTNIYCVGEADVRELLEEDPCPDVIVTLSAWNHVSVDAFAYGRELEKGVFAWRDFFGALNYRKYWLYESMPSGLDDSEKAKERRRRQSKWN